jgi:hypothetical protein
LAGGSEPQTGRFFLRIADRNKLHKVEFGVTGEGGEVFARLGNVDLVNGELVSEGSGIEFSAVGGENMQLLNWMVNGVPFQGNNPLMIDRLLEPLTVTAVFGPAEKTGDMALDSKSLQPGEWDAFYSNERIIIRGVMDGTGTVHIIDITGRRIISQRLQAGSINQVDPAGLQKGVYLIQITENNRSETKRVYIR